MILHCYFFDPLWRGDESTRDGERNGKTLSEIKKMDNVLSIRSPRGER